MRSLLVLTIVFGSLPVIFVKPHVGVLVWSWIAYMNPHRLTWGAAYSFPFAMVIGSTTIAAWLISREPKRFPLTTVTGLLIALAFWTSISTVFAQLPDEAYPKWDRFMKILLMTFVTLSLINTRQRLHMLVWVIVASIGFYGVKGGAFTVLTGGQWRVWGPPNSFLSDNNALALALLMVVPLMRYLQLNTRSKWVQIGLLGAMGLMLLSILGTYSRGSFIGLSVVVVYFWLKSRRRMLVGLALAAIVISTLTFMPDKWWERIESIQNYQQETTAQQRFASWLFGFRMATDSPLVGGGFNVFGYQPLWDRLTPGADASNAHSIYFEMLGEHGFVGFAIFLAIGIASLHAGRRVIRATRDRPDLHWARDLAAMTQVSLIAYAAAGVFYNRAIFDLYYHMVAIMVLTEYFVRNAIEKSPESTPEPRREEAARLPTATRQTGRAGRSVSL